MELAKVTSSGQITLPSTIRKKLGVKEGDKVLFVEDDGKIVLLNSSVIAIEKLQHTMKGEAEKTGITSEEDVVNLCKDIRKEVYANKYENND